MDIELLPLVMLIGGVSLLYSAYQNKKPLGIIQAALSGKPLTDVEPIDSEAAAGGLGPGTIPLDDLPRSKEPGDGLPGDPKLPPAPDGSVQGVLPILPGERSGGNAPISYRPVNTNGRWV